MASVLWHPQTEPFLLVDASETLGEILQSAREKGVEWIIIDRENGMFFYAYRAEELIAFVVRFPDAEYAPALQALDLHEGFGSSTVAFDIKPVEISDEYEQPLHQPSMTRLISVDENGRPVSIGEIEPLPGIPSDMFYFFTLETSAATPPEHDDTSYGEYEDAGPGDTGNGEYEKEDRQQQQQQQQQSRRHFEYEDRYHEDIEGYESTGPQEDYGDEPIDLGRARGSRSTAPPPDSDVGTGVDVTGETAKKLDVTISAECPEEIQIDREGILEIRLELTEGAQPLARALPSVQITEREAVDAILSVDPLVLEVVGPSRRHLAPPSAGVASTDIFLLRGKMAGETRVSIEFYQGGTELGSLVFTVTIAEQAASVGYAQATAYARPRNFSDDDSLTLMIRETSGGSERRLLFTVTNSHLDMYLQDFESRPLKDAEAASNATLRYVRTIYKRLVEHVLEKKSDLKLLEIMLQGIGIDLSRQLFPDDFVRKLWTVRDRIGIVQVTSFEPHIPWELVRLQHPDTKEIDDRYLAEYGLVRRFSGVPGQTELRSSQWSFLVGEYPSQPEWELGSEVDVLEQNLIARGVRTRRIPSDPMTIYEALSQPDFDVLYIACHGETDLDDIELTTLSVSERTLQSGEVEPLNIDATTVSGVASLRERRPIVFLNACETAQQTTSLSDWGGWPKTFWEAGAGAYIGTSWSVLEKPAISFATAFQTALFDGQTLAEASRTARQAAKESGDSSWLAYVVYGTPSARLVSNRAHT
jgi:hypothetical protein